MLRNRMRMTITSTAIAASSLGVGYTIYNIQGPSREQQVKNSKMIVLSQNVCEYAKVLNRSYDGTFSPPTSGVDIEPLSLEIELNLSDIETISCGFLTPDLQDYATIRVKNFELLNRIHGHINRIMRSLFALSLKENDTLPLITTLNDIEKIIQ